jgi:hypothetical protein
VFDHLEYDAGTLRTECLRDRAVGRFVEPLSNYLPNDDLDCTPVNIWRPQATRLFGSASGRTCTWPSSARHPTQCPLFPPHHLHYPSRRQPTPTFAVLVEALCCRG